MESSQYELFCPTAEQIAEINETLVGGRKLRSLPLLESATYQPYQTFDGHDLYPTPFDKAAALLRSIAENQPFVDGNKRTAWLAARILLRANGITIEATKDEIVELMLSLAAKTIGVEEVSDFLLNHARASERPSE